MRSECSFPGLIGLPADSSHTVSVQQRENENPMIALMHVGLIAGTPTRPRFAFSVDLLDFFYRLRRRQPSIGIQGFVKAACVFQQVCDSRLFQCLKLTFD